jgi:hypothetical protein
MPNLIQPPAGLSNAEESEWWYAHREAVNREIELAFDEGRMRPASRVPPSQRASATTILLGPAALKKATALAEKRGVTIEAYLAEVVQAELDRDATPAEAA